MQISAQLYRSEAPHAFAIANDDREQRYFDYERLGISEARSIQAVAYRTPQTAARQVLIIRSQQLTTEAQNALLKVVEEPPATTDFALVIGPATQLLPTLSSRLIELTESQEAGVTPEFYAFLAAPVADRLTQIEQWQKAKNQAWLDAIHAGFLVWLRTNTTPTPTFQLVAERLNTRGASNKLLLEALALEFELQKQQ